MYAKIQGVRSRFTVKHIFLPHLTYFSSYSIYDFHIKSPYIFFVSEPYILLLYIRYAYLSNDSNSQSFHFSHFFKRMLHYSYQKYLCTTYVTLFLKFFFPDKSLCFKFELRRSLKAEIESKNCFQYVRGFRFLTKKRFS